MRTWILLWEGWVREGEGQVYDNAIMVMSLCYYNFLVK